MFSAKALHNVAAARVEEKKALVQMYRDEPHGELSLEEFERLALDRIQVLRGIKDSIDRGKRGDLLAPIIKELIAKHLSSGANAQAEDAHTRDLNSHYVCRLAFCRTPDDRSWFLQAESELFKYRLTAELRAADYPAFLERHGFRYQRVPAEEIAEHAQDLMGILVALGMPDKDRDGFFQESNGRVVWSQDFYRVPFEDVPDLVRDRRVLVKRGVALVPQAFLTSLIVAKFRSQVSRQLADMNRKWTAFMEEEAQRLVPVVERIKSARLQGEVDLLKAGKVVGGVPTARDVEGLLGHFPLCMYNLYQELKVSRHLKHKGRLQLGLFLKGIGLPMEESLVFWRQMFAPKMSDDKFQKEHAYNIRHNYGREGNRKDYKAHNCLKIIGDLPGNEEHHGCPYRHVRTKDDASVRAMLSALKVAPAKLDEAINFKKEGHFQLACAAAFEGATSCVCEAGINHPNSFYDESRKIAIEREASKAVAVAPGPSEVTPEAAGTKTMGRTPGAAGLPPPSTGVGAKRPLPTPGTAGKNA